MTNIKRNWDILDEKEKADAIDEIISFFRNERGEEIGVIAAGNILDLFLEKIGMHLYNKGVDATKDFFKKRLEENEIDLDATVKKSVE
jgi:uncharacterized protein (DUF2164 family)